MKRRVWNVAMRGRDYKGGWNQTLEVNFTDICNAITTVQKDNFILEKREMKNNKRLNSVYVIGCMDHIQDHTYESANRVYGDMGICPTIPVCASDKTPKVLVEKVDMITHEKQNFESRAEQSRAEQSRADCCVIVIGRMDNTVDHTFESANRVYSSWGICPTIPTCAGGNIQPKVLVKVSTTHHTNVMGLHLPCSTSKTPTF